MKKISLVVVGVGLSLTVVSLVIFILHPAFIQDISNKAYDALLRRVAQPEKSGVVAIVDLDDASLQKHGQWPWPRYRVAKLTQNILDAGAAVVGFDIVFAEKDRTSPRVVQEDINKHFKTNIELKGYPDNLGDFDELFAETLKKGKTILGCQMIFSSAATESAAQAVDPCFNSSRIFAKGEPGTKVSAGKHLMQAGGMTIPIELLNKASSTAFFNADPGSDNIVRSNPLVWAFGQDRIYPALALEAVRLYTGAQKCVVKYGDAGIQGIIVKDIDIPTDQSGRMMVNYRSNLRETITGFTSSFPTYPAADVLDGKVGPEALKGKIVFVGASATGLKDIKASPLTQWFSGVEVHATMVDNILAGDMLCNPDWMPGVHAVAIILMGAFLTFFIARGKSWLSFLVSAAVIFIAIRISMLLIGKYHVVFVPAWVILSVMIIYPVLTMIKFWQEEIQKKQVRDMFGTMVSHKVLHFLENNPGSFSLSGKKVEATMFFSDVRGFTTISESLSAEKLSHLLNRYLSPMTEIIMERGGYVDKYEGDLIMADWGVPYPVHDHATQACLAALEQQDTLAKLRPALKAEFGHDIHVRMGINSGTVTAGNMGSNRKMQYTVIGDAVNQASRFEPINKDYGTRIIIGETTYNEAKDSIEARLLDRIIVKGKTVPIGIYELVSLKGALSAEKRQVIQLYEEGLRLHWERKWDAAIACFDRALGLDQGDGPSAMMRARVLEYRQEPPPEHWDGDYARGTKD